MALAQSLWESVINKMTSLASLGLAETFNSIAYRIAEIEAHFHNQEKWFGAAASASGETHVADVMGGTIDPFAIVSGASDFGNWVQILGSADTPVVVGNAFFDAHRFLVTTTDSTEPFILQIASGESAGLAAKIAAMDYTSAMYIAATNSNDSGVEEIMSSRVPVGEKVWVRVACVGVSTKTINAYFGVHEYDG
jgi:hypothetical protein